MERRGMTPLEEFQKMMDNAGVTAWHNKGIKGKGINILNCESGTTTHGKGTLGIMKRIAPEANFFFGSTSVNTKGDVLISANIELDNMERYDLAEYVKANNIHIIGASKSGINDTCEGWNDYCMKMQAETGVIIVNSAGNNYASEPETLSSHFPHCVAILVGALNVSGNRVNYSSIGEQLDFMIYSGLIGGTSASQPFLTGMIGLILSRYRIMTQAILYDYLKRISVDLGTPGDDIYHGEGMPVLPEKTKIEMWIGNNVMLVDGIPFLLEQAPVIDFKTDRTLIPVRAAWEAAGGIVDWDGITKKITLEL